MTACYSYQSISQCFVGSSLAQILIFIVAVCESAKFVPFLASSKMWSDQFEQFAYVFACLKQPFSFICHVTFDAQAASCQFLNSHRHHEQSMFPRSRLKNRFSLFVNHIGYREGKAK